MKHFHKKRLLKLADFLDKLPTQKFRFDVFAIEDGKPMLEALEAGEANCGTVACAIGWMPAIFPRQIKWQPYLHDKKYKDIVFKGREELDGAFETARVFFGIEERKTVYKLFDPVWSELGHHATPKQVAQHIREFLANQP